MVYSRMLIKGVYVLFIFTLIIAGGCARHRVTVERPPPLETKGVYHTVERHQTLYRICKTYGVDIKEVARINGITDHRRIQVGEKIFIPRAKKVLKVEVYIDDVVMESPERERVVYKKFDFVWPVEGRLGEVFDETENKGHMGIDISSPIGTPIKASSSGRVIYSGNTIKGYGNLIILRHSEEYVTIYAHNQINLVEEGEWVEKGQIIGKVGKTGRASGPHLHFEIRRNNKPIDPLLFLVKN